MQTDSHRNLRLLAVMLFLPAIAAGALSGWLFYYYTDFGRSFASAGPPCKGLDYPPPKLVNYSGSQQMDGMVPSSQLMSLTYRQGMSVQVSTVGPVSIATGSGAVYGIFSNGSGYSLARTGDLQNWDTLSRSVVPPGYLVTPGGDLSVTREGVVIVSATRLQSHANSTIFVASFDGGASFQTVMNATLKSKPENHTGIATGPGSGFWHGVKEASNGYLFAGLYNPQGLVYRSEDQGRSWGLVFNASRGSDWHNEIHDLEVNPRYDFLYVTTDDESGGVFNQSLLISTDMGNHWTVLYNALEGGSGLPLHLTPTTVSFMDNGATVVLGLEGWWKSAVSRSIFLLNSNPNGCLAAEYQVAASSQEVDPFISWWTSPYNDSSLFVLTHENDPSPQHGVGLFLLTDSPRLTTLMVIGGAGGVDWYSRSFLQMAGPTSGGVYALVFSSQNREYFAVVKL